MADTPNASSPTHTGHGGGIKGFFTASTAGLPNWAWLLVIAGGIAAAYIVPKLTSGLFGGQTQGTADTSGGTSGSTGLGLAIDPTTGLPYAVEGLTPAGGNVGGGTQSPPPNQTPTQLTGSIALLRQQYGTGRGSGAKSATIPVRATTSGNGQVISQLPAGSSVEILGPPVQGQNNFPGALAGQGTTTWYPVQGGYISAFDVVNVSTVPLQAQNAITAWPNVQQTRMQ